MPTQALSKVLIVFGLALVGVGLWLHFGPRVPWLGRLPGDIRIERPGVRFYFPITTSVLLSVVISVILYFLSRGH